MSSERTEHTPEVAEARAKAHCDFFGGEGHWDSGLLVDTKPVATEAMRAAIAVISAATERELVSDAQLAAAARKALGTWLAWPDAARDGPAAVDNEKAKSWLHGLPNVLAAPAPSDQEKLVAEIVAWFDKACPDQDDDCVYLNGSGWDDLRALITRARQIGGTP